MAEKRKAKAPASVVVKVVTDALLAPGSSIVRAQERAAASRAKKASAPTLKQAERGVPYVGGLDHANNPKRSVGPATSAVLNVPRPDGEPFIEGPKSQTAFQRVQVNQTKGRDAQMTPAPQSARMSSAPMMATPSPAPVTVVAREPAAVPRQAPPINKYVPSPAGVNTNAATAGDAKPIAAAPGSVVPNAATSGNPLFSPNRDGPFDRLHRSVDKALFGGTGGKKATYSYPTGDNRSDKD